MSAPAPAGDGSGKPLGLVHASSPYTVVNAATGSSLLYKLADLMAVYKALPAANRTNASWLMNADDFGSLAGTADTAGGTRYYLPPGGCAVLIPSPADRRRVRRAMVSS